MPEKEWIVVPPNTPPKKEWVVVPPAPSTPAQQSWQKARAFEAEQPIGSELEANEITRGFLQSVPYMFGNLVDNTSQLYNSAADYFAPNPEGSPSRVQENQVVIDRNRKGMDEFMGLGENTGVTEDIRNKNALGRVTGEVATAFIPIGAGASLVAKAPAVGKLGVGAGLFAGGAGYGTTIEAGSPEEIRNNMLIGGLTNVAIPVAGKAVQGTVKGGGEVIASLLGPPKLKPKQLAEALRRQAVEETANKTLTSPVLEERKIRRDALSNQGKDFTAEAAAKRTSEAGERAAAAALELKRMDVPPIGKLASPEELGVPLQAEARAQKAALKKDSDAMWKKLTAEMDALEASKTGVGQTISYGQKYKDFIKELNKRASATAGDPQDRQYAKLLLEFVDEKYPMRVKPSHLMEMKRYIAQTAFDPASGFKAIASQRKKEYVARLDDMLGKHFTDPKTGTSPYDLRNKNYENFITKQEKLYSSRFGRKLTGYDKFGVSLNTPTEAAVMVLRDPQAVRAALAQGVSVPTIEATMTRNLANEFDGKTPEAIAKLLQPGGNLYSKLEIPQLARVKEETRKYLTNITDQKQNSLKIDSYNTVAEKFANEASQLDAAAVKSGTSAKNQERKIAVGEKILEAKRAALLGKLNDAEGGDIKEMMAAAKEGFVGNEPKLSEIRRVEKMNVSDDEKRKRIRKILIGAGAAVGLASATRFGLDITAGE